MKKLALAVILCFPMAMHAASGAEAGKEKAPVCAACHGLEGVSSNPEWPNLAGQHASYILKQLKDYKSGARSNPSMNSIVATLTEQDMADLADFYSEQPIPPGATPKAYLQRGEQLYRGGDMSKQVTACIACHGPRGTGNAQAMFPVMSGQHAIYNITQLKAFKTKERKNDLHDIMRDISSRMSEKDMQAVSYYMQGLH